jgi:hypothetical protein
VTELTYRPKTQSVGARSLQKLNLDTKTPGALCMHVGYASNSNYYITGRLGTASHRTFYIRQECSYSYMDQSRSARRRALCYHLHAAFSLSLSFSHSSDGVLCARFPSQRAIFSIRFRSGATAQHLQPTNPRDAQTFIDHWTEYLTCWPARRFGFFGAD